MPTKEIEEALEPKRIIKIFVSVLLIVILFIGLGTAIRMANNAATTVGATSRDHVWFTQTLESIRALDQQISQTQASLEAHQESVNSRLMSKVWVSSDDRAETQQLTRQLLDLQERRSNLVRDYNTAAEAAKPEILGNLPKSVSEMGSSEHEN